MGPVLHSIDQILQPLRSPRVRLTLALLGLIGLWVYVPFFSRRHLTREADFDFFAFFNAAEAFCTGHDALVESGNWYIYPPLLGTIMMPLVPLGINGAAFAWYLMSIAGLVGCFVMMYSLIERVLEIPRQRALAYATLAVTCWACMPQFLFELRGGQNDWIVLSGILLAIAHTDRRPWLAGLGLAVAANIKYVSLLAIPYLLLRRRYAAAAWTVFFTIVLAYAPSLVIGWEQNQRVLHASLERVVAFGGPAPRWIGAEEFRGVFPITWEASVSIPSFAGRVARDTQSGTPAILVITAAAAIAALAAGLWIYRRASIRPWGAGADARLEPGVRGATWLMEWQGVQIIALVFSPQMCTRHTVLLSGLVMVATVLALHPRRPPGEWFPLAAALIPTLAAFIVSRDRTKPWAIGWPNYYSVQGWAWLIMYLWVLAMVLAYVRARVAGPSPPLPGREHPPGV